MATCRRSESSPTTPTPASAERQASKSRLPVPSFQWLHDNRPIAGATRPLLAIPVVTSSDAGAYAVRVSNVSGSTTSAVATLVVGSAPVTPIVDPHFRADPRLDASSGEDYAWRETSSFLLPLPDGRVVVALSTTRSARIVRLRADGSLDPAFAERPMDSVRQLALQRDGRVLVGGVLDITKSGGALLRLNEDGTVDNSFNVPTDLDPTNAVRPDVSRIIVQPDGRILLLVGTGRVVRLLPEGQFDPEFQTSVAKYFGANAGGGIALSGDGKVYCAIPGDGVKRLLPNGQIDATFVSPLPPDVGSRAMQVFRGADDRMLITYQSWTGAGGTSIGIATGSLQLFANDTYGVRGNTAWIVGDPALDGSFLTRDGTADPIFGTDRVGSAPPFLTLWAPDGRTNLPMNWGVAPPSDNFIAAFGAQGELWVGGDFSFYNGVASPRVVRLNRIASEGVAAPRLLGAMSDLATMTAGGLITLSTAAICDSPVTYEWDLTGTADWSSTAIQRTLVPSLSSNVVSPGAKTWSVRAHNSAGVSAVLSGAYAAEPRPLVLTPQATRVMATEGRDAQLLVTTPVGVSVIKAEWRREGVVLPPTNSSVFGGTAYLNWAYTVRNCSRLDAGGYDVTLTTSDGQRATSAPIVVTVGEISRLGNFSVRARTGPSDQAIVVGFVVSAGAPRQLMIRGVGPGLAAFGVADRLSEPLLELCDSVRRLGHFSYLNSVPLASDYYSDQVGAFHLPTPNLDAVVMTDFSPVSKLSAGVYTVRLSGNQGETGMGLLEIYEADNISERLTNFSARVFLGENANAIAGFAIRGPVSKRVLIRVAGPALAAFGVSAVLANPRFNLLDEAGREVGANDDWQSEANGGELSAAAAQAGAFGFANGSKDAAAICMLRPGNYTANVTAPAGQAGTALLEIYELP